MNKCGSGVANDIFMYTDIFCTILCLCNAHIYLCVCELDVCLLGFSFYFPFNCIVSGIFNDWSECCVFICIGKKYFFSDAWLKKIAFKMNIYIAYYLIRAWWAFFVIRYRRNDNKIIVSNDGLPIYMETIFFHRNFDKIKENKESICSFYQTETIQFAVSIFE